MSGRSWICGGPCRAALWIAMVVFPYFTSLAEDAPRIVFLGDSLTAGYGLDQDQAFPALLDSRLSEEGIDATVVNAGVSGDTSAGGLRRLDWVLGRPTDVLVVALGGNDGLRGLPPEELASNLTEIIRSARESHPGITVLLAGMRMPGSMGVDYQKRFASVYPEVADETGAVLVPFLLEGVAGEKDLNFPDGIHPNAEGQAVIAETVWPFLKNAVDGD